MVGNHEPKATPPLQPRSANKGASREGVALCLELPSCPKDLQCEMVVCCEVGGATHFLVHGCCDADVRFSVGYELGERAREAILKSRNGRD